jgi:hypothetical protein
MVISWARPGWRRVGTVGLSAAVALGALAAGPASAAKHKASKNPRTELRTISSQLTVGQRATFKAVYTTASNGHSQTVTVEQAPPQSLLSTPDAMVLDNGKTTYFCSTSSGSPTCITSSGSNPLASLVEEFNPTAVLGVVRTAQAELASHATADQVKISSTTIAGQPSECLAVTADGSSGTYCVTKSGVLARVENGQGEELELTSYSGSAPANDFTLPSGATVVTLPTGVTIPGLTPTT